MILSVESPSVAHEPAGFVRADQVWVQPAARLGHLGIATGDPAWQLPELCDRSGPWHHAAAACLLDTEHQRGSCTARCAARAPRTSLVGQRTLPGLAERADVKGTKNPPGRARPSERRNTVTGARLVEPSPREVPPGLRHLCPAEMAPEQAHHRPDRSLSWLSGYRRPAHVTNASTEPRRTRSKAMDGTGALHP